MKLNKLGKTGISISEIGLGTCEMSGDRWGKKDDSESMLAINTALDNGVNFIDTAAGYGSGHVEELVGKVLKNRKDDEIVVSTKVRPKCGIFAPSPEKEIDNFFPPNWIVSSCEQSLKRLQLKKIDVLFLHTWSRSWGHRTEWYNTLQKLKDEGKIGAFGISIPDEGIADANVHVEAGRVDVIQCVYNMFQQEPEHTLFPLAKKQRVGIIARSPFSSGALIGNWTKSMTFPEKDWRGVWPKNIKKNWLEEQVDMANAVNEIFKDEGLSMTAASLRYIISNDAVTSVIPGSANPKHVKANIAAAEAPAISENCIKRLRKLWAEGKIHGTYNGSI